MSYQPERALTLLIFSESLTLKVRCRNELPAREGIDTKLDSDTVQRFLQGRNELPAREGIDTLPVPMSHRGNQSDRNGGHLIGYGGLISVPVV